MIYYKLCIIIAFILVYYVNSFKNVRFDTHPRSHQVIYAKEHRIHTNRKIFKVKHHDRYNSTAQSNIPASNLNSLHANKPALSRVETDSKLSYSVRNSTSFAARASPLEASQKNSSAKMPVKHSTKQFNQFSRDGNVSVSIRYNNTKPITSIGSPSSNHSIKQSSIPLHHSSSFAARAKSLTGSNKKTPSAKESKTHFNYQKVTFWDSAKIFERKNQTRGRILPWWMTKSEALNPAMLPKYNPWWLQNNFLVDESWTLPMLIKEAIRREIQLSNSMSKEVLIEAINDIGKRFSLSNDNFSAPSYVPANFTSLPSCYPEVYSKQINSINSN